MQTDEDSRIDALGPERGYDDPDADPENVETDEGGGTDPAEEPEGHDPDPDPDAL